MNIDIKFTESPIVIPPYIPISREIGAMIEFHGLVREMEDGEKLEGLFYEAYAGMAGKILVRHLEELGAVHACSSVEFIHRLGWVPVGDASLYIRVQSAHRGEALLFLADSIDRLKLDVPIWKKSNQ